MNSTTPTNFFSFGQLNEAEDKSPLVRKSNHDLDRIDLHDRQTKEPVMTTTERGWGSKRQHGVKWHPDFVAKHPDLDSMQHDIHHAKFPDKTSAHNFAVAAHQRAKDMGFKKTVDVHTHHVPPQSADGYHEHIVSFHDASTGEKIGHSIRHSFTEHHPESSDTTDSEFTPNQEYMDKHKVNPKIGGSSSIHNTINKIHHQVIKNKMSDKHWAHGVTSHNGYNGEKHNIYETPHHSSEEVSKKHEAHLKNMGATVHRTSPTAFHTDAHNGMIHHSLAEDGHLYHGMMSPFRHIKNKENGNAFNEKL